MAGDRFQLVNGQWVRPGWDSVPPGSLPGTPGEPPPPPPIRPALQVTDLSVLGTGTAPGGGTGGGGGGGGTPSPGAWPGDPGPGKYLIGWALGPNGNATIPQAQTNAGWPGDTAVSVIHDYSGNGNGIDTGKIDAAHNRGFIASQSIKINNYTPAQIAAGTADAAIDTMAAACHSRAPKKIWLCYYHEPEDNIGSSEWASFRAATRRIVLRMRAAGVTNVAWMPIYMNPYTFSSGSGRDWRNWHADWTGTGWQSTLTMDLMGMDTYNPLPFTGTWKTATQTFHTFAELWTSAKAKIEQPGYPQWDYVMPEFGMSNAFSTDPNWLTWCQAAAPFMQANRIKAAIYWDNSADIGRYSFAPTGPSGPDANGTKKQGWDYLVSHSVKISNT